MAIQVRQGPAASFNPDNLLAGELAYQTDTHHLIVGHGDGTYDDFGTDWQTQFNNLRIGTRNIIPYSDFSTINNSDGVSIENGVATLTGAIGVTRYFALPLTPYGVEHLRNQKVTLSIEIQVSSAITYGTTNSYIGMLLKTATDNSTNDQWLELNVVNSGQFSTQVSDWKRYISIYTISDIPINGAGVEFYFRDATGAVKFRNPCIKIGEHSADSEPAPEDYFAAIAAAKAELTAPPVWATMDLTGNTAGATAVGPCRYAKLAGGKVRIEMHFTYNAQGTVYTMPEGYRPANDLSILCVTSGQARVIYIGPDGKITTAEATYTIHGATDEVKFSCEYYTN